MLLNKRPKAPDVYSEFIVIGAGIAGLTIAKYLAERGKEVWLLGSPYESQFAKAGVIEDCSLPEGTVGLKFIEELVGEVKHAGVKMKSSMVTDVDFSVSPKKITTKFQTFYGQTVIIATGAKQKKGGFKGEIDFYHQGISDCAVCDGNLFRGRVVGVYGNHKYTIKAFHYLSSLALTTFLFWDSSSPPDDLEYKKDSSSIYFGFSEFEVFGDDGIQGVRFKIQEEVKEILLDGLFVEGEPIPNSSLFKGQLEMDGDQIVVNNFYQTSVDGVYAIGDVTGIVSNYDRVVEQVSSFVSLLDEGKMEFQ